MSGSRAPAPPGFPLPPGSTIGVVGGGQLGRMLALAAARLGLNTAILAKEAGSPAGRVAAVEIVGDYSDGEALTRLAAESDVVTFEFENVPAAALSTLEASGCAVSPPRRALAVSQDRLEEKTFLNAHGLTTTPFAQVDDEAGLRAALDRLGRPALLKTRREGYDGKGQVWIHDAAEAGAALERIGARPAVLEARAPFRRELSVIAARSRQGALCAYPLSENHHEAGVLRRSLAPAAVSSETAAAAEGIAFALLEALDYVGVIGVELFELETGALWVNEFAPRVHNTGHWTLDGCQVDQFEQHIRAVAGWPLGPSLPFAGVEMTNLLGEEARDWLALASEPGARLWLYGKNEDVTRRKMGHVNRLRPLR